MKYSLNSYEIAYEYKKLRKRKYIIRWLLGASFFLLIITFISLWLAMQQAHIFSKVRYNAETWYISNVSSELYRLMLSAYETESKIKAEGKDDLALRLDVLYGVLDNSAAILHTEKQSFVELPDVQRVLTELRTAVVRWSDLVAQASNEQAIRQVSETIIRESRPLRQKINVVVSKVNQTYNQQEVENKYWLGDLFSIFSLTLFLLLIGVMAFIWRVFRDGQITENITEMLRAANHNLEDRIEERTIALQRLASIDELTGTYNRRAFFERAEFLRVQCNLNNVKYGVLMLDIDHFKNVNDQHGHLVGDEVIKRVAAMMGDALRKSDIFGRVGGEEFAAILPVAGDHELLEVANCMCDVIASTPIRIDPLQELQVTVSIGVTMWDNPEKTLTQLLSQADIALYQAKENGRNSVNLFKQP